MLTTLGGDRRFRSKKAPRITPIAAIRLRFWLLRFSILLLFGILTVQLWNLQVVNGKTYALRAENNKIREQFTPPPRGVIFDRDRKPLVVNVPTFAVSVMPADLRKEDQAAVAARLAAILRMRPEEVEKPIAQRRLAKRLFDPVIVKSGIAQDTAFMIAERRQELPGVSIIVEPVRQYLGGPYYSHLLGYMGRLDADEYARLKDQGYGINERVGKTGLELSYERELRGQRGRERIVVDVTGAPAGELESIPPVPGHSLVLTIDSDLQNYAARVVNRYMRASKYGVAMVMDVNTGELLAMVSVPGYDNNLFTSTVTDDKLDKLLKDPGRPLVNHAISENFPPGSIFKLITAGAALQERIATPSTTIFSPGYLELSGYRFPDWGVLGALDFYQAVARSGDVYFYTLGGGYGDFPGLGPERLAAYSRLFGLGERSGIRLPGEVPGNVPTPAWKEDEYEEEWYTGDTYHFAIGQGFLTVTPLQMLAVVAAFANGGDLLRPQLVKEMIGPDNQISYRLERDVRRSGLLTPEFIKDVVVGMELGVTWSGGTATGAYVPGLRVAAKTGTAEFGNAINAITGRYENTHGWCFAFAPVEKPEIAVLVFLEQSTGPDTAPAVGDILHYYFSRPAKR